METYIDSTVSKSIVEMATKTRAGYRIQIGDVIVRLALESNHLEVAVYKEGNKFVSSVAKFLINE